MANPYAYAGNNPVNLFDPAGLRPITTEELDAYRKANAPKWGTALAIVAGVGLAFVPGAQGFAAALIAGAVLGGGASIIDQACSGYPIDWGQVGKDALFGLGGGAFGYGVGKGLQWAAKTPVGQAATQWVGDQAQRIPVVQHITNRLGARSAAETAESLTDDALNAVTTPARTSAVPRPPFPYSDKVINQLDDLYHGFPRMVDDLIYEGAERKVVQDVFNHQIEGWSRDSAHYVAQGSINGVQGQFEIFTRISEDGGSEMVWHRFFRRGN